MLKTPLSHADIAQLVEQLVVCAVIPGSSPAAAIYPDRAAVRDSPYIQTQRELWQETEIILHKSV